MNCEHDHQKGKLTINSIEKADVDNSLEELYFFNMRLGKIENLEGATKCIVG